MSLMLCKHGYALKRCNSLEESFIKHCIDSYPKSYSQRAQDLFAVWANFGFLKNNGGGLY
jgi:hypothetical protein